MAFEIVKAGWLFRESSFLKRWKKNWFVLYTDGYLKYFESPDSHVAEDTGLMPASCIHIKTGSEIQSVKPPDGHGRSCLLTVVFRDKTWNLCAESPDDMSTWKMVLEDARIVSRRAPQTPQYSNDPPSYTQVIYDGYNDVPETVTYIQPNGHPYVLPNGQAYIPGYGQHQGNTTVIVREDRRDDMANGMLAGAMVGTAMWMPLLWW